MTELLRIAIVVGSTRPNRKSEVIARWVSEVAGQRDDAHFELVDLRDIDLPLLDEPQPASRREYANEHTKAWAAVINDFDGFIFVTPEYNHSYSGVLKNAIDYAYNEWNNKVAAFVSYGFHGGQRAAEHLRLVMSQLQVATVQAQVCIYLSQEFDHAGTFTPAPQQLSALSAMLDQLVRWTAAMATIRWQVAKDK